MWVSTHVINDRKRKANKMKNWGKTMIAAGLAMAVLSAGMITTSAMADPLKDRKAAMKSISEANKVIKGYTKGKGDLKQAVAAANQIASIAKALPDLFPAGSGKGYGKTTRAKPAIWSDWKNFQKANDALVVAASRFASRSSMGDAATMKASAGAIGKSCGGCHKLFRGKKIKKKM